MASSFFSDVQRTLLIHEVHDLVEVHFAAFQVRYLVELEAGCGHLLGQLVKRVVQHDLIAGFERQLEYEVKECLELSQPNLDFLLRVGRAEDFNAKTDLFGHRAPAKNTESG